MNDKQKETYDEWIKKYSNFTEKVSALYLERSKTKYGQRKKKVNKGKKTKKVKNNQVEDEEEYGEIE